MTETTDKRLATITDDMVERAAEAMFLVDGNTGAYHHTKFANASKRVRNAYAESARAALEAALTILA